MIVASGRNLFDVGVAVSVMVPIMVAVCWIAFLVYKDSQDQPIDLHLPRLVPWSVYARIRHRTAEIKLAQAETELLDIRHQRLQRQMVLSELEETQFKRALDKPADG